MKWSDLIWQKRVSGSILFARLSFGDTYELSIVQELNEKWTPAVNEELKGAGFKVDAFHFWVF